MTMPEQEGSDLREHLRLLQRRGWILVLCVVLLPLGTYLYTDSLDKVYQSSVVLQIQPTASDSSLIATQDFAPPPQQNIAAVARLAQTSGVADEASRILREPRGSLRGAVGASSDEDTGFVTITASAPSPTRAAEIANAFGEALGIARKRRAQRRVDNAIGGVQQDLRSERADAVARRQLSDQLQRLRALRAAQGQNAQVIEPAVVPGAPVSPNPRRNAILALILALLIGVGLMALADRLDRRLHKPEELERLTGGPLLATIPREAFPGGRPAPRHAEAFQTLRDALTYFNVDRPLSSVMVVSPLKGEGKTTVATNLAVSVARSARRVILVDADLRHGQVAARMGVDPTMGLSTVLTGGRIEDSLHEIELFGPNLRVMPAGRFPPNPSELIGSKRMSAVLAELSELADVIVLDTAPLLVVSDSFPLLEQVSGAVALARLDHTPRDAVKRMLEIISTARGRLFGVVPTGARAAVSYGYGYGYGYGYEAAPEKAGRAPSPAGGNGASPAEGRPRIVASDAEPKRSRGRRGR